MGEQSGSKIDWGNHDKALTVVGCLVTRRIVGSEERVGVQRQVEEGRWDPVWLAVKMLHGRPELPAQIIDEERRRYLALSLVIALLPAAAPTAKAVDGSLIQQPLGKQPCATFTSWHDRYVSADLSSSHDGSGE